MAQKAFFFNMMECTGCKCCQVACKDKNDFEVGYLFRKAADYEGGIFPAVWSATLASTCSHCESPICVANCPVGAITKEEEYGLVIQDHDACIGCQTCVNTCPYGSPVYFPEENKSGKCDGCIEWLRNDMQPACIGACSTRCLKFEDVEVIKGMEGGNKVVKDLSVLPSSKETEPNFYIISKEEMI